MLYAYNSFLSLTLYWKTLIKLWTFLSGMLNYSWSFVGFFLGGRRGVAAFLNEYTVRKKQTSKNWEATRVLSKIRNNCLANNIPKLLYSSKTMPCLRQAGRGHVLHNFPLWGRVFLNIEGILFLWGIPKISQLRSCHAYTQSVTEFTENPV